MSTETLPAVNGNQLPAIAYRGMVEKLVSRELAVALEHNPNALAHAKARVAQAFRAAAAANPQIFECTPASVANAVIQTLLTGLAPGGVNPTCYLLPRRVKGVQELQWQVSHRGLVQLATRAGYGVRPVAVHAGDDFELNLSDVRPPTHRPGGTEARTWDNLIGCYAVVYRLDTAVVVGWDWMDKQQIEARRGQSDAWKRGQKQGAQDWEKSSPWYKWPIEMALKTVIKWVAARGVLPTDDALGRAMEADAVDAAEPDHAPVPSGAAKGQPDFLALLDQPEPQREEEEEAPAK